ncbi:MAG: hypothetical protein M1368_12465 [Thaumarchaeota archaeon]|nr:hypothetical protein [Nitrososphaerota archaeon]
MTESEIRDVESVRVPNAADEALLEFGQSLATKSVDTLVDFAKIMVTLISGLFATYFALLKFVGLGAAQSLSNNPILLALAATPPILLIVSLLFVVLGALFPISQVIALNDLSSINGGP